MGVGIRQRRKVACAVAYQRGYRDGKIGCFNAEAALASRAYRRGHAHGEADGPSLEDILESLEVATDAFAGHPTEDGGWATWTNNHEPMGAE